MKALESAICIILTISTISLRFAQAQTAESLRRKVVLEVIEKFCEHDGELSRSVYLWVFSDGTAEAHTPSKLKWYESVEQKKISDHDYDALRVILESSELQRVKYRYERMYPVLDSWTEWEIRVKHPSGDQTIEVSGFSPSSARTSKQDYPEVLTKLGCSIWKIRQEVHWDYVLRGDQDCKHPLEAP